MNITLTTNYSIEIITQNIYYELYGQNSMDFDWQHFLPSATKLRRLCFYRRLSVHRGGVPDQVHPPGADTPPGPGTPPRAGTPPQTRYTHPPDQVHPPPRPGTPPQIRYTPLDQVHPPPPAPGTPPQTRYTPSGSRYTPPPRTRNTPLGARYTPRTRYTPPAPGTPPRYGHCCGRYASYWNAFLFSLKSSRLLR